MQVQLSGQKIEITQALRERVNGHCERLTRLESRLLELTVVLSVDKVQQCCEGTLKVPGAAPLHAEAAETDMYVSIDTMFDKLVAQLRKHRDKVSDKHQREVREERQYG